MTDDDWFCPARTSEVIMVVLNPSESPLKFTVPVTAVPA